MARAGGGFIPRIASPWPFGGSAGKGQENGKAGKGAGKGGIRGRKRGHSTFSRRIWDILLFEGQKRWDIANIDICLGSTINFL
jgi:hypothetical protein